MNLICGVQISNYQAPNAKWTMDMRIYSIALVEINQRLFVSFSICTRLWLMCNFFCATSVHCIVVPNMPTSNVTVRCVENVCAMLLYWSRGFDWTQKRKKRFCEHVSISSDKLKSTWNEQIELNGIIETQ